MIYEDYVVVRPRVPLGALAVVGLLLGVALFATAGISKLLTGPRTDSYLTQLRQVPSMSNLDDRQLKNVADNVCFFRFSDGHDLDGIARIFVTEHLSVPRAELVRIDRLTTDRVCDDLSNPLS